MSSHRLGRFMAVNKMVDCTGPFVARKGRLRCRPYSTPQADDADSTRPGSCRSGVRSPPQAAAAAQSHSRSPKSCRTVPGQMRCLEADGGGGLHF